MFSATAKNENWHDSSHLPGQMITEMDDGERLSPRVPRVSVDAHEILGAVVRECQPRIGSKGLKVSMRLLSRQYHVSDDGERLRQTYLNLLTNAVATARPGSKLTLRATCPSDCALRIEIEERSSWRKSQAHDSPAAKKPAAPARGHR